MTQKVSIYARYSSDLQNEKSIEDQLRICNEKAASENWEVVQCYTDAGMSGASLMRPGIQSLLSAAQSGQFNIVVAEALDRLSRDQEDIAGIYKRLQFAGVKIITLSEGEISSLHIGLKGTMNAMFLKDLADKTRRGLRGRVEQGKSGGGITYGYKVVKRFDTTGEIVRGEREIDEDQASIVRRIFKEYALENKSPKAIAAMLNKDGISCPSGATWGQSTINGNRKRGTGILNNCLYIGELVWNRQRYIKDPETGKRVSRLNPETEWIKQSVPELRIVPQDLWDAVKAKQKDLDRKYPTLAKKKRPQYLLSGLLVCGECGGRYSVINSTRFGCSTSRNKGESVCSNRKTITIEYLEKAVLNALQKHLLRDDLVQVFCEEYEKHINTLRSLQNSALKKQKVELAKLDKEKDNIIQAIKDGVSAVLLKDELERVSTRQEELKASINAKGKEPRPLIHPTMARRYRQEIQNLRESLASGNAPQAKEYLRSLIEKIVLTPKTDREELSIDLHGDLAGILSLATEDSAMSEARKITKRLEKKAVNDNILFEPSVKLVAGGGFEPPTFGL